MNSSDCTDCAIQVVVSLDGVESCLFDGPQGVATASVDLLAPPAPGSVELLWGAVEEADCPAALAAANPMTSLGTVNVTPPGPLQVLMVTPADQARDVVVASIVRVTLDDPPDQSSLTGRVTLSSPMGAVPVTITTSGNDIVVTPSSALTEFQTQYAVLVSAGITGNGRTLQSDFMSTFTTRMFVPNVWYGAHNDFQGVGWSLGVDAGAQCQMLPQDDTAIPQRFRFVPQSNAWVGYNDSFPGRAFSGADGVTNCSMLPVGPNPDQLWSFVNQTGGAFLAQNQRFGIAQSLDNSPQTGTAARPLMQPTTAVNRQFWRWRRLP